MARIDGRISGLLQVWRKVSDNSLVVVGDDAAHRLPVDIGTGTITVTEAAAGTATQSDDITVDGTVGGVTLLAANANRKSARIANTGGASAGNMRVTFDGSAPTATHGEQLAPGQYLSIRMPFCETAVVKAIREGSVSTTASRSESV